jgi:hypothetical protein
MNSEPLDFLDMANRKEALIVSAAVALHGIIASGVTGSAETKVEAAFTLAREFLRQAERVTP